MTVVLMCALIPLLSLGIYTLVLMFSQEQATTALLSLALAGIELDLALKFVLVAPLAVALSFLVGYVVKKLPLARDIV